jgi:hypothetical protein
MVCASYISILKTTHHSPIHKGCFKISDTEIVVTVFPDRYVVSSLIPTDLRYSGNLK